MVTKRNAMQTQVLWDKVTAWMGGTEREYQQYVKEKRNSLTLSWAASIRGIVPL